MDLQAIVFDLDDTLVVKSRERQELFKEVAAVTGVSSLDENAYEDAYYEVDGHETRAPIFEVILDEDSNAAPERIAAAYRDVVNDALESVDDINHLLEYLSEELGYRLGVLTDGPAAAQRSKLAHFSWSTHFEEIVVTSELGAHKPDSVTFETICKRLDVPPESAVYVGDKPETDIAGAAAVGMVPIQVRYDGGPDTHPDAAGTVQRSVLVNELPAVLRDLTGE